jgi:hypothetical protein
VRFGAWNVRSFCWAGSLKKDKIFRAFSRFGIEDECIQGSGGKKTKRIETIRKTWTYVGV